MSRCLTATEKGEVKLGSSWEVVRKNVQKALDKWDEKAYGVLQAIIDKGGRAAYFEIIDEIEKVLGYDPIFGKLKRAFLLPSQITNPNNTNTTNFTVYFCFIFVLFFLDQDSLRNRYFIKREKL